MLDLENIWVSYGAIRAVRDVSMKVSEGEIVTLLGPNGAGKTTILGAVMGINPLSSGDITFEGRIINGMSPEQIVWRGMTLVPEGRQIFPNLTVGENLRIGSSFRRDRAAVARDKEEVFELFPILSDRLNQLGGTLSGGEQQQLTVGRALMSAPRLLLLDEPSLGLAPRIVDTVFELTAELRRRGRTILLVEQNAERALEIADRGYVFINGEIALSGMAEDLAASSDVLRAYMGIA
jgi:branched-chain amino acid transport system ATP-binding protein